MKEEPISEYEKDYILFIESLELNTNKKYNKSLKIEGKLLHETDKINVFFGIFIYKSTEINPFEADIEMTVEFIENEAPYVQMMTNFLEPTIYDLKNYFLCLSRKNNYVFSYKSLGQCQAIFLEIIANIQIILHHLYNCELFGTFIYFGEYNLNHIYHINSFLKNSEIFDFFKINRTENEMLYDKILYLIFTELYVIVFEPLEKDKSLAKILFCNKLSETSMNYEEINIYSDGQKRKKLKVRIEDIHKRVLFKDNNYINSINNHIKISFKDDDELKHNPYQSINNIQTENVFHDKFEFLFINKEENDEIEIKKEYENVKKFALKKLVLEQKGYKNIISPYWLLFNFSKNLNSIVYSLEQNREEVDKIIEYNEHLYNKYVKRKTNLDIKIINNAIKNIIFLCSEITSMLINDEGTILKPYVQKIQKYSNINK